jgi:hypothetical protein
VLPIERDSMSDWITRYEALVVLMLFRDMDFIITHYTSPSSILGRDFYT